MFMILLDCETWARSSRPLATIPAAKPAKVPSTIVGKTLLVPVEMATMGRTRLPTTAARLVPSPPRVIRQSTPCSAMAAAARTVSPSE